MAGTVLSINAGSSSLKCAIHQADGSGRIVLRGSVSGLAREPRLSLQRGDPPRPQSEALSDTPLSAQDALNAVLGRLASAGMLDEVRAVGHRVVHGGHRYVTPTQLDPVVIQDLRRLAVLAPVHQDVNLDCAETAMIAMAQVPHVACFDTAFHHEQPRLARLYALPRHLTDQGLVRYGFHGLSFAYIADALDSLTPRAKGRVLVAHLGSGASLCAIQDGRSIATTMGLTPLDGLPMSTRSGALDPGLVLHLIKDRGMAPDELSELLLHRSGLLGVSGISGDMRELLTSAAPEASEAVDLFVYRTGRAIGSLAAALGGLDVLVFTAGIGENAPEIRRRICTAAQWLGVRLDEARNMAGDGVISTPASAVEVLVTPTDEESMISRLTIEQLRLAGGDDAAEG